MAERDPEAVARFIEHFASAMVEAGLQRMPARVFAALQATDSGRLTSAELAEMLQVSPAAISGAVRFLVQFNMVRKERELGTRRDQYVVDSETWHEVIFQREKVLLRWQAGAQEGVDALGVDTPAGARMVETVALFGFLHDQMAEMLPKWRQVKAELKD